MRNQKKSGNTISKSEISIKSLKILPGEEPGIDSKFLYYKESSRESFFSEQFSFAMFNGDDGHVLNENEAKYLKKLSSP